PTLSSSFITRLKPGVNESSTCPSAENGLLATITGRMPVPRLLPARFQAAAALIKPGLHCHHAKLPIFHFPVVPHHPHKINGISRHCHIRMKSFWHHHRIAIAHHPDELRLFRVRVHELHSKRRRRHVVIHIQLFQHRRVLVWRPARPVPRL